MQRSFLIPVIVAILAAAAYYERAPLLALWRRTIEKSTAATAPAENSPPAPALGPEEAPARPPEPAHAPPGSLYMLKRVKMVTETGVKAVNPGEEVKILEQLSGDRVRVTVGNYSTDFTVAGADVTDDTAVAREAERKFKKSPESKQAP